MDHNKYRSRRWIMAKNVLVWSRVFATLCLLIGIIMVPDEIGTIITGVLTFLGGVHALVYGAYAANRAYTDKTNQ